MLAACAIPKISVVDEFPTEALRCTNDADADFQDFITELGRYNVNFEYFLLRERLGSTKYDLASSFPCQPAYLSSRLSDHAICTTLHLTYYADFYRSPLTPLSQPAESSVGNQQLIAVPPSSTDCLFLTDKLTALQDFGLRSSPGETALE